MRLVQFLSDAGERRVGRVGDDGSVRPLSGVRTTYELALQAARESRSLADLAAVAGDAEMLEVNDLLARGRVLAPLDHPDPAHCLITGTIENITFLGSIVRIQVKLGQNTFYMDTFNNPHLELPKIGDQTQITCSRKAVLILDQKVPA